MGLSIAVTVADVRLEELVAALAREGLAAMVVMIDGALVAPGKPLPDGWRDARLRTPAGTVTLARGGGEISVVVFGNADAALVEAQRKIAAALRAQGTQV